MKNHSTLRTLLCLVMAVAITVAVAACGGKEPSESPSSDQGGSVITSSQPIGGSSGSSSTSGSDSTSSSDGSSASDATSAGTTQKDMLSKMTAFYQKNDDTVGWLNVPGTTIDEVVVQAPDNDYYLRRNNMKQSDFNGCYYADYRTNLGARKDLSKNVVIYGHSMDDNPDGARFSQLKKYLDIEYCKQNPYLYFSTPEAELTWQIFAVYYTDINFDYIDPNPDAAKFTNMVSEMKQRSQFVFDVDVSATDTILTLSTCTYKETTNRSNYRYVVQAKLLPAGASLTTPVKVEVNPSPKSPF